jgi:hypothetical protein
MTSYACNEFIAFSFREPRTSEQALRRAGEQLEQHTPYRVCDLWLSPRRRVGVLNLVAGQPQAERSLWTRLKNDWLASAPHTNRLRVRARMAILQTGYTTTPERRFERSIRDSGPGLVCEDAGGIAAFCLVRYDENDDERLFVWSTRPGLRVIASAEAKDALVVGTRPRLVHALTRDFRPPDLERAYLHAALNGWSCADLTPYRGTTLVPVDALLRIRGSQRSLHDHPTPRYQREARIFRKQRVIYRDALREAVAPLRSLPGFELQLSGGKDSRLLAAALFEQKIAPSSVAYQGSTSSPEFAVAEATTKALGFSLKSAIPTFAYRGGLLETVRHNMWLSDGFFATEPRHIGFPVGSLVGDPGPGLVMGHMELQKGGWAYNLTDSPDEVVERCKKSMTRWRDAVVPELSEAARRQVDAFVAALPAAENAEYGYALNYQFRVGRWLTSHYLGQSRERLPVYPLIEEKVTRVVSCAPLAHLVSERLLAETTWALAPQLRATALFGDHYRFIQERAERKRRSAATQVERRSPVARTDGALAGTRESPAPSQPAPAFVPPRRLFVSEELAREASAHIMTGKLRDELRALTQAHVWQAFEDPSQERMLATGMGGQRFTELLWTYYQASVLFTDGLSAW